MSCRKDFFVSRSRIRGGTVVKFNQTLENLCVLHKLHSVELKYATVPKSIIPKAQKEHILLSEECFCNLVIGIFRMLLNKCYNFLYIGLL